MTNKTKYTAEDFARAEFARHPDGRIAARVDPDDPDQWRVTSPGGITWRSDQDMADGHWTPVRDPAPITLEALEAAWEQAEKSGDFPRRGDLVIKRRGWGDHVEFRVAYQQHKLFGVDWGKVRILQRAPRRPEGAEELADVMRELAGYALSQRAVDEYADRLAERGVRVVTDR
ncbi:hypothetical protein [Sediminivirga luteola]|uniref:Uncharacterized protein n=1 Tax=Sediminivirga luteola TaxID=1774748 RepID=A0A8J2TXD0_9MICO|nr:hypothetical protein [Sediminivirga luteola]GGA10850.1 hypothetical protein GCM10011333_12090 [Sediminivirga luteola]